MRPDFQCVCHTHACTPTGPELCTPSSHQINTLREFELLGEEAPSPLLLERLRSCCLVVEALGYQVRRKRQQPVERRGMVGQQCDFSALRLLILAHGDKTACHLPNLL